MGRLTMSGFVGRWFASVLLVMATYNPSGVSFLSWVSRDFPHIQPTQAVVGVALLGLWVFFLHATWRSLGALGVILGLAFFGAVIWMVSSWGWIASPSHAALTWVVLLVVACMLTIGLCWGLIRARVSGQAVVEEVSR